MRNVLVTGGCGFIGRNLVPALVRADTQVRVLDNFSVGTPSALEGCDVEMMEGDVRDFEAVTRAVQGMDAVVHLAAQTGVIPSQQDPRLDFEVNAGGTLNLLLASREGRVGRFVVASSGAPLGNVQPPVHEAIPPKPTSPYGASKLACEGYCSAFYGSYGLHTVALRIANVYGPRSSHKQSVVARFAREGLHTRQVTIYGDGQQTRDFIHVDDVCEAFVRALEVEEAAGQVIQVATGVETKILDLAQMVRIALGQPEVRFNFLPARPGEIRRNFARIDRARQLLGWNPRISISQGVPQTCQWFVDHQAVLEG